MVIVSLVNKYLLSLFCMVGTGDRYIDDQDGNLLWPYFRYFVLNRLFLAYLGTYMLSDL